ncbi:hypothetical protein ACE106_07270 [Shouchella clausii]|uniref:hypothetical protein n=1 Tax=Shouchella clausii TaxID=79880 RepID=UPI0028A25107|nr:hypothetical protein [Shouchella clausii]
MQITKEHLEFMNSSKKVFAANPQRETHRNEEGTLIALRMGIDRDCINVYELGEEVANFVQMIAPHPYPTKPVRDFSFLMQGMLDRNAHKGGWDNENWQFLQKELAKHFSRLDDELKKQHRHKEFIVMSCVNIANFAMMIAKNEGESWK